MSTYVIVDLEMCKIPLSKQPKHYELKNELIQIGAVRLDEKYEITDEFKTYVRPVFGTIDKYIEKLTGISPAHVKDAPEAKEALEAFLAWLPEDAVLVSWSDNDERQIRKETACKDISLPRMEALLDTWVDCQKTFGEKMDSPKTYALSEALNIAGIFYEDGAHDALVDAHNTALLFAKMNAEGGMKLSPYYTDENHAAHLTHNPFAALLKNYKFA